MAIQTNADLQAAVAQWMNRTDLAAQIPLFISIAESRIRLMLRVPQLVTKVSLTQLNGTESIDVPPDWLEWDKLFMVGDDTPLQYVPFEDFCSLIDQNYTDGSYSMDGNELYVGPPIPLGSPNVTVNANYYAAIPPLVGPTDTNWLLTSHPELYLYGAAVSGWQFVLDEARAQQNGQLFDNTLQGIADSAERARLSGSQWRQRGPYG